MTIIKTTLPDKKAIYFKLGFVICLIVAGLISYKIAAGQIKEKGAVLGKKIQKEESPANNLSGDIIQQAQNTASDIKNSVYGLAQNAAVVVGDTATTSATIVKEYILNTTVSSAVKQLDGLPSDVKEKIKENICK